jgi:2-polyprenyl-6-hydroxyphenyl methylase/3-demethylubiquinone-9 3-methyltransferase
MDSSKINNEFYGDLASRWYEAYDDPVALLRAENEVKVPWIEERLIKHGLKEGAKVLDVGCGAGLATNRLAKKSYKVTGVDLAEGALEEAKKRDQTNSVQYIKADAYKLPFEDESFDAVISLDFLEHVYEPQRVIDEISRVLKPSGLFFYHTFSKNWLSYLIVIKGVEWFVKNTPKNMHLYELFIDHKNIVKWSKNADLDFNEVTGIRPIIDKNFFSLIKNKEVPKNFKFTTTGSTLISYLGYAKKSSKQCALS